MKKLILSLAAMMLAMGFVNAQDLGTATETYNNGAEQLSMGNKEEALAAFQEALTLGEACGDEGADLVANCKNAIPAVILSIGKELYNSKDFEAALAKISEAIATGKEYGVADVVSEAEELVPVISSGKALAAGNAAFQAKNYVKAIEGFKEVLTHDADNGVAALRLVQCLSATGDIEGAKEYLAVAETSGQGANAKKVLGGALLKKAAASLKAKQYASAIEDAVASTEYTKNAQAYLIAGQAATAANKGADAIGYYEQYLEASPNAKNAGAIAFTVAALYQQAGDKAKAIENYKKVLTDPTYGVQAKAQIDALSK